MGDSLSNRTVNAREKWGTYIAVAAFGSGSRLASLGLQFATLILLARVMEKGAFGEFMTVFAAFRIVAYGIGTGCMSGLIYHVARNPTDEVEIRAHRSFAAIALAAVVVIVAVMLLTRNEIGALFHKPGMGAWILLLAPFGIFSCLIFTAAGAMDGRQRINESIFYSEFLPNLFRFLFVAIFYVVKLPSWTVAVAFSLSVAIPYAFLLRRLLSSTVKGFQKITAWDLKYSTTFIGHSLLSMQLQGVDMLIVSYLFSSEQAADYAIASRVAVMYPFLQQIIFKKFLPRCGLMVSRGETDALAEEAKSCRDFSIVAVSGLTAAIMCVTPWLLRGVGDYASASGLMVALAAPAFARAFFAGGDAILRMTGAARFSITIMLFSFLFVVLTPIGASHWLGVYTLPLGMTLSAVVLNPFIAREIHRRMGWWLIDRLEVAILIAGLAGIVGATYLAGPELWRWPLIATIIGLPGAVVLLARGNISAFLRIVRKQGR